MGLIEQERQANILAFLKKERKATVSDLADRFNASESTLRRDLSKLEKEGHLHKTYGGAILSESTQFEPTHKERLLKQVNQKKRIGSYAAQMVKPASCILLDSGTTTLQITKHLNHITDLTVITYAIPIVQELGHREGIQLYMLGGLYRPKSQDVMGPVLNSTLSNFSVDIAFLSVDGFDPQFGLSAADPNEAEALQAARKIANKTVVVADSTKGGKRAFSWICSIEDIDMIISDNALDKELVEEIEQAQVKVKLV